MLQLSSGSSLSLSHFEADDDRDNDPHIDPETVSPFVKAHVALTGSLTENA
jgi:hypothetical protein